MLTLVASALAGGDCIDAAAAALDTGAATPSTTAVKARVTHWYTVKSNIEIRQTGCRNGVV